MKPASFLTMIQLEAGPSTKKTPGACSETWKETSQQDSGLRDALGGKGLYS
jgi:hypothetical protein